MALFYQINFTIERQQRARTGLWLALAAALCLLAGLALCAAQLYEEWNRMPAQPRLQQLELLGARASETLDLWRQAAAAFEEVRPYVAQEDELPPHAMMRKLEPLAALAALRGDNGFLPRRIEVTRSGRLVLSGDTVLPDREKAAHCDRLQELITNTVVAAALPWREAADLPGDCRFAWDKAEIATADARRSATVTVTFDVPPPLALRPPPDDLANALAPLPDWRKAVRACKVKGPSGRPEPFETVLRQALADNRAALGEHYERIRALADTAIDPLAVTAEIRRALGGAPATTSLTLCEEAWKAVALKRLRREPTLDNPALDAAVARLEQWSGCLPRTQDLNASRAKSQEYLDAMTNAVKRHTITQEETFWEDVLQPAVSDNGRFTAAKLGEIAVPAPAAARVAFPEWRVTVAAGAETKNAAPALTWADAKAILLNVETNAAGLWVTAAELTFDDAAATAADRWHTVRALTISGRVPCRLCDTP